MQYFESHDKAQIAYRFYPGKASVALLALHGWTADSSTLEFLRKELPEVPLFIWDARCHGKSQVDEEATVSKMAADLRFFIDHVYSLKLPLVILGHSMGALTLWETIQNSGTRGMHQIIVVDQSPKLLTDETWNLGIYGNYPRSKNQEMITEFEKDLGNGVITLSTSGLNQEYNQVFQAHPEFFYQRKRNFSENQARGMIHIWKTLCEADYRKVLPSINIPALLLYGEKSQYYKRETALYVADQIPETKTYFFKRGDHSPFVQHPEGFSQAIRNFLALP